MFAAIRWSVTVVLVLSVITPGRAQTTAVVEKPTDPPGPPTPPGGNEEEPNDKVVGGEGPGGFIVPQNREDDVDVFGYEETEFLVVNRKRRHRTAELLCQMEYSGKLAALNDFKVGLFMAEALSETNLVLDALWTGGVLPSENGSNWVWQNGNETTLIDPKIIANLSEVKEVTSETRNCLAFARLDHDQPDYRALACNAQRAVLCQRARGGGHGNSTHPGWIQLGKRQYKIFAEQVPYDVAGKKCFETDADAQLAVIIDFNFSQLLGRYLLVGRPSLENAWIGARWHEGMYRFEPEPTELANQTDLNTWPPWRNRKISKTGGCVLLDRHLDNITLFVEARCDRDRAYICYKSIYNDTGNDSFTDIIIGDNGYRLHFARMTWNNSVDFCKTNYSNYKSYIAEVPTVDVKYELLYVMGENRTAVQHIWLGGLYVTTGTLAGWTWMKDDSKINLDILDWVKNDTYNEDAEQSNVCLDMDRENHISALHYGAVCEAKQQFVCAFTKADLLQLEDDERRRNIEKKLE